MASTGQAGTSAAGVVAAPVAGDSAGAGSGGPVGAGAGDEGAAVPAATGAGAEASPLAGLAQPIARAADRFVLELGERVLEVDPTRGARIVSFAYAGHNVLQPLDDSAGFLNGGSTLWTSPQSDWSWPPLPPHDVEAYSATVEGEAFSVTGGAAELAGTRVSLAKRFAVDPARDAMRLEYTLQNVGEAGAMLAAWEVSRHPTGGLAFWRGQGARGDFTPTQIGDHEWLSYAEAWSGTAGKVFADVDAGWLAYVQGELLVLRSWDDVPAEQQAPGEAEVEVYLAAGYVELEVQGPFTSISAGGSSSFGVRWQIVPLAAGTAVEPGNEALIALVEAALR